MQGYGPDAAVRRRSIRVFSRLHLWGQIETIELLPTQIMQRDSHDFVLPADFDHAKKLQTLAGWSIRFEVMGNTQELDLGSKRVIQLAGAKGAGMQGPGNEFPKGVEVGELRLCRVVEMGCGIVHV